MIIAKPSISCIVERMKPSTEEFFKIFGKVFLQYLKNFAETRNITFRRNQARLEKDLGARQFKGFLYSKTGHPVARA